MNKFVIDYEYGVAEFWTAAGTDEAALADFYDCATECFGIRKSLGDVKVTRRYPSAEMPLPYRGHGATHLLAFGGDEILFDRGHHTADGSGWKLRDGWGDWCSCRKRGTPELACKVHHFQVPGHGDACDCLAAPPGSGAKAGA